MGEMLQEIKSYWSERAEGYSKVNQEELEGEQREKWIQVLKEKFPDQEPEEIKVLDIGTGPGFFAVILAEQGYQVTAVDYTEEMLKEAKKNAGTYADKTLLETDGCPEPGVRIRTVRCGGFQKPDLEFGRPQKSLCRMVPGIKARRTDAEF